MKKLLTVLLILTVTLVGCGNLSAEEKVAATKDFSKSDDEIANVLKVEGYSKVDYDYGMYYIKSKQIKEDNVTEKDLDSYQNLAKFESYSIIVSDGGNIFIGSYREKEGNGYINYLVVIIKEEVSLQVVKEDKNGEYEAGFAYTLVDGELKLEKNPAQNESKSLIEKHEKKAKKFFEKAFKELGAVIS